MSLKSLGLGLIIALFSVGAAAALPSFEQWAEQRFSLFSSNDWQTGRSTVSVRSEGTVSMLWSPLPAPRPAGTASWSWDVSQSVPPTQLDVRGGDDRNLSLYFIFMPEDVARANAGANIRKLLDIEEARVLMYVQGGSHARGEVISSPYLGPRGRTITLRPAGEGTFSETVDLARDFRRAFGETPTHLVGLALSADSDDTDSVIQASIENLRID